MATIDQLDCIVVFYKDDAKMSRIPCNFLQAEDIIKTVSQYWIDKKQTFYTSVAIEYMIDDRACTIYTQTL